VLKEASRGCTDTWNNDVRQEGKVLLGRARQNVRI
jgi:hypothetical protein